MSEELLRIEKVGKRFGKITALQEVNLTFNKAEVVGLVGDNGAGKSTLIKIISGYHTADSGSLYWEGKKVRFRLPKHARNMGIETVYQEQALAPDLTIARNVFMGREPSNALGIMQEKLMEEESMKVLRGLGLRIKSPDQLVKKLSGGQRQGVAIARALYFDAKMVILDEPTIALSVKEVREVLEFVNQLKQKGIAVIFITHNLHHIFSVADRLVVLANGEVMTDVRTENSSVEDMSDIIVKSTLGALV
ncbi:MAG: sugar ABC transporter ATP-binding protein [Spirochaetaceae bacterium]|nr:MAG: sugar ABC transporter ATP-binding protein [Spirochaetaceae bacterium]